MDVQAGVCSSGESFLHHPCRATGFSSKVSVRRCASKWTPWLGLEVVVSDKQIVEQRGLWFEEFEPDVLYVHRPGRTITEADNVLFTTLTMNTQALHLDAAFSEALPPFNQRLVNSMFTLSTLVGLSVAQLTQGTIVGNLGFSDIAFPKPLFHGDTLYAESEVIGKRESRSRPGEGIVTFAHTGRNQHGDVVATASRKTMVRKRPGGQQQ